MIFISKVSPGYVKLKWGQGTVRVFSLVYFYLWDKEMGWRTILLKCSMVFFLVNHNGNEESSESSSTAAAEQLSEQVKQQMVFLECEAKVCL